MKTVSSVLAAMLVLAGSVFAGPTTVKGRVVDEGCQVKELIGKGDLTAATSMDACAVQCAKRGEPLALLTTEAPQHDMAHQLLSMAWRISALSLP